MSILDSSFAAGMQNSFAFLYHKARTSARKAVVTQFLNRSQYMDGIKLVRRKIIFETTATVPDIMKEIALHVHAAKSTTNDPEKLYLMSRTEDWIIYAFETQNAGHGRAAAVFTAKKNFTKCIFSIQTWPEEDGIVIFQDVIRKLSKEITHAFLAADPMVIITETDRQDRRIPSDILSALS